MGKGKESGGTDAGGEEVGQQDGRHNTEEAGRPQEPKLMGEVVVGVMRLIHLPLQSAGKQVHQLHTEVTNKVREDEHEDLDNDMINNTSEVNTTLLVTKDITWRLRVMSWMGRDVLSL